MLTPNTPIEVIGITSGCCAGGLGNKFELLVYALKQLGFAVKAIKVKSKEPLGKLMQTKYNIIQTPIVIIDGKVYSKKELKNIPEFAKRIWQSVVNTQQGFLSKVEVK